MNVLKIFILFFNTFKVESSFYYNVKLKINFSKVYIHNFTGGSIMNVLDVLVVIAAIVVTVIVVKEDRKNENSRDN